MKRIFITFILALFTLALNAQVKVLGKIEPNGSTDTYPTHVDSLGKGGLMAVSSWQERNAIPLARRKAGMLVRVKSATVDSTYTIGGNLANADWRPFVLGGSGAVWGSLTGSMINQTDLMNEFNNKLNKGGGTVSGQLDVNYSGRRIELKNGDISLHDGFGNSAGMSVNGFGVGTNMIRPTDNLAERYFNLPAKASGNYTIATTADIPGPVDISGKANLTGGNTFTGNQLFNGQITTTTPIIVDNVDSEAKATLNGGELTLLNTSSGQFLQLFSGGIGFKDGGPYSYLVQDNNVQANNTVKMPTRSGKLPVLDNDNSLSIYDPTEEYSGKIWMDGDMLTIDARSTGNLVVDAGTDLQLRGGVVSISGDVKVNSSRIEIGNVNLRAPAGGFRDVDLPSSNGTIALVSDISGKSNLVGGNAFTGNQTIADRLAVGTTNTTNGIVNIVGANATTSGSNAQQVLNVVGGNGASSSSTGFAVGGQGSKIRITSGTGGGANGSGFNQGGNGGEIYILAGDGGNAIGGANNSAGFGGNAILQGGTSLGNGIGGSAQLKAGNSVLGNGGHVYVVAGYGSGGATDISTAGAIALNVSDAGAIRGNTLIGMLPSNDDKTNRLQVGGSVKDTDIIDFLNNDDEMGKGYIAQSNLVEGSEDLGVKNATVNGLGVWFTDNTVSRSNLTAAYNPNWIRYYMSGKDMTVSPPASLTGQRNITYPDASGTIALTSDIPKMFIYSTIAPSSGSTTTYTFPHGLDYTPTMVIATPNNNGALINCEGDCIVLTTKAEISGNNIVLTCIGRDDIGPEGGAAVKWTIMVK